MCEEYESFHERTGRLVVMGQSSCSIVLSAIKTEVLLGSDDAALTSSIERTEKLSQQAN